MLKYDEVATKMEAQIIADGLTQGDKLPKLTELMAKYAVSKSTIVKALAKLEQRGLIYQIQGSGVFVRRPKLDEHINLINNNGFTADMVKYKMTAKVLSLKKIAPPKDLIKYFNGDVKEVYEVKRIRYLDDQILCLEESYFKTSVVPFLNEQIAQGSIFNYVRELGIAIGFSDKYLNVIELSKKEAKLLELPEKAPALTIEETYYLTSGEAFDHSKTTYHFKNAKFFIQSTT